ncbi:MAG: glycosyltransferase family 4 protein [Oscillospiraceae bacterium]|nr:glycosyltransferase family 4 protein [Oscillospiraceae bacterium]
MAKILIVTNGLRSVYNFRKELIEHLVADGNELYACAPNDIFAPLLEELGCHIIPVTVDRRRTNPIKDSKLILNYFKILSRLKPDIVLNYTAKGICYSGFVCGVLGIPYTNYIEGIGTTFNGNPLKTAIIRQLFYRGCRKASRVVFMNDDNLKFFLDNHILTHNRYTLIRSTGINLDMFTPAPYPDESKPVTFSFSARILKEKGIDIFINVAKSIKQKYPHTDFHVMGEIEEQVEYEAILNDLQKQGILTYHGLVADVRPILHDSHCFLFPSYYGEGRNVVLQEACACARPVITGDVTGCRESCIDGYNGFLVPAKDEAAFFAAAERFINLPYSEKLHMSANALALAKKDMNRVRYVQIWAQLIADILQENK